MQIQVLVVFIVALVFNALANILIKASALKDLSEKPDGIQVIFNPMFIGGLASFALYYWGIVLYWEKD